MNNLPTIKLYKIDYEFIIKNYLDRSLWKQIWNLFVFKDNIFTLQLASINTQEEKIYFDVSFNKLNNQWLYSRYEKITYDLNNMTIDMLKKSINGAIFRLAERYDEICIKRSDEYSIIEDSSKQEEEGLREIAEDFLDSEGVTNSDIREAYIDAYVDDNNQTCNKLSDCINYLRYNFQTELLLMICNLTKDNTRMCSVVNNLNNKNKLEHLQQEIKEFMNYIETDDWIDEMRDNLIAV